MAGFRVTNEAGRPVGELCAYDVGRRLLVFERDEPWASLVGLYPDGHVILGKTHGLCNFPTRSLGTRIREGILAVMLKIPAFGREFRRRIREEMIKPLSKVVEQTRHDAQTARQ